MPGDAPTRPTAAGPRGSSGTFETSGEFARAYRVEPYLLPWNHRQLDLCHAGQVIGRVIDSLRPTKVGFTAADVVAESDRIDTEQRAGRIPTILYLAHGAYPIPGEDRPIRYANPSYVHRHSASAGPRVTARDDRRRWLMRYARLGSLAEPETPVTHFGLAEDPGCDPTNPASCTGAVTTVAAECGIRWGSRWAAGDEHMGRVLALTLAWKDVTTPEVAAMYATTPSHVLQLVREALARGFRVPPQPTVVTGSPLVDSGA